MGGELAAGVGDEKVGSDEADEVEGDEVAKVKFSDPFAEGAEQREGEEEEGGESKDNGGNGDGDEGEEFGFANEDGDEEPCGEEQEHGLGAAAFAVFADHRVAMMMRLGRAERLQRGVFVWRCARGLDGLGLVELVASVAGFVGWGFERVRMGAFWQSDDG